jgi:hypothetical protein
MDIITGQLVRKGMIMRLTVTVELDGNEVVAVGRAIRHNAEWLDAQGCVTDEDKATLSAIASFARKMVPQVQSNAQQERLIGALQRGDATVTWLGNVPPDTSFRVE